jgi:hypothetical protein
VIVAVFVCAATIIFILVALVIVVLIVRSELGIEWATIHALKVSDNLVA